MGVRSIRATWVTDDDTSGDSWQVTALKRHVTWPQVTGKWLHLEKAAKFAEEQNATNFGGFNDWRIPKLEDVKTIFDEKMDRCKIGDG